MNASEKHQFMIRCASFRPQLVHLLMKFTRCKSRAEDLVQDAYLKVLESAAEDYYEVNLYHWLCRITINLFFNFYATHRRRQLRSVTRKDEILSNFLGVNDDYHQDLYPDIPLSRALNRVVVALNDNQYTLVKGLYIEGKTVEELANENNVPRGTVLSRVARARRVMADILTPYFQADNQMLQSVSNDSKQIRSGAKAGSRTVAKGAIRESKRSPEKAA